ncbi:hypothetical protein J1N35_043949 [Gossypium stocksii]|uniref:Uncharacterized protein n=1 Tax=Gossypium stocksii TaxID=47602 RepID=A0A9D3ZFJ8_9ROSI|nr:hypothetical protein J1N35_043949 [Gossypium stocksii]
MGCVLDLMELVLVRDVFQQWLKNLCPNGYNPTFRELVLLFPLLSKLGHTTQTDLRHVPILKAWTSPQF